MKKQIFVTPLLFVLLASLVLVPFSTEAACKSGEYLNASNKCVALQVKTEKQISVSALIQQLQAMIVKLQKQLEQQKQGQSDTSVNTIDVVTRKSDSISYDKAKLNGEVKFKNKEKAIVYFEYGKDKAELNSKSNQKTINKKDESKTFSFNVKELDNDTVYYYRAVGEDETGIKNYGGVYSLKTGIDSLGGKLPSIKTGKFDNVDNHEAEINGSVNMYNYEHGIVFFAYGESRSRVDSVDTDYDEYTAVKEDGKNLKKASVDNDLSSHVSYGLDLTGLTKDTKIYYSVCVQFTDEDGNKDIGCGETLSFVTGD